MRRTKNCGFNVIVVWLHFEREREKEMDLQLIWFISAKKKERKSNSWEDIFIFFGNGVKKTCYCQTSFLIYCVHLETFRIFKKKRKKKKIVAHSSISWSRKILNLSFNWIICPIHCGLNNNNIYIYKLIKQSF